MQTYKLVQYVDGCMVVTEMDEDNLFPAMSVRGFVFSGFNRNKSQRAELQGQPKFKGVLGPMWDGGPIRYECPETYRQLSA